MTLFVNKRYEQLTGLKKEELIGRLVTELVNEGKYDVVLNPDIVKTGKPKTSTQVTRLGRNVILDGYPVFNEAGKVALVVTFVRDVTLLSQMKEQIDHQQSMIDKCRDGVQLLVSKNFDSNPMLFNSPQMQTLIDLADRISRTDATVLLLGETGVGKDILARRIHERSPRANKPFFKIDCATIPANLIESELFGYEPGAFSGANTKGKPGFFEMADTGTLFLDEIGELPVTMQAKLLRVLQDQEVMRLGSTKVKKVDIRIIAATNRDLHDAVKEGTFRSDLYYRLRVAVLNIPPLRERTGDILPLAEYFMAKFGAKYRKHVKLSDSTKRLLESYRWPGNVREMENLIQSLIVTRDKQLIENSDLPNHMMQYEEDKKNIIIKSALGEGKRSLSDIMEDLEKNFLKQALDHYGSVTETAKALKVDRATVYRKMKKHALT